MTYGAFAAAHNVRDKKPPLTSLPDTGVAQLLAYFAAAPLIGAALYIVGADRGMDAAAQFMALYGAALIVFFGGVRWGVAVMRPEGPTLRALLGAAAPLLAGLPLFLPWALHWKFIVIMALVAILLVDDLGATRRGSGAPAWYLAVRLPLTVLVEIAFLVAMAGM